VARTYPVAKGLFLLMLQCQYCDSQNVRWFTPRRYASRAAVLLCMGCRRLTIVPPRAALREMSQPATAKRAA
jgi:hypothetical protein